MYYKIGNNRTQLEKIFIEDKDKRAIGDAVEEEVKPDEPKVEEEKKEEEVKGDVPVTRVKTEAEK